MTALEWATAASPGEPSAESYCSTESEWHGRFDKFVPYLRAEGVHDPNLPLVANIVGEIGDNCFTHNIGTWRDVRGCWFSWSVQRASHELCWVIADRGQGILSSFAVVRPDLATHRDALRTALTEQVTSRQPENRGRGLKVVIEILSKLGSGSFVFQSGDAKFTCQIPCDPNLVFDHVQLVDEMVLGTYCEMKYRYAD